MEIGLVADRRSLRAKGKGGGAFWPTEGRRQDRRDEPVGRSACMVQTWRAFLIYDHYIRMRQWCGFRSSTDFGSSG